MSTRSCRCSPAGGIVATTFWLGPLEIIQFFYQGGLKGHSPTSEGLLAQMSLQFLV
jgi:hypothetical protein